jgi:hypothetical protein
MPHGRNFTSAIETNYLPITLLKFMIMNIRKGLIVAAVFMSFSAITFAQAPAKPAKKEKSKTEKSAADTAKAAHKAHKPVAKKAA